MDHKPETDEAKADHANRKAPEVNPTSSGIRTGNPQLDPEAARKQRKQRRPPRRA